ncbi:50S ribosomal protein L40e [Candidatus Micrarchaeota archaeon CG1_02_55_22]|nr:MAG: 50S ribosomal protein L40e [Candidatus Micrarchaeota archaeon CG1_02_55_22]
MGNPIADKNILNIKICLKCKARNAKKALKCRKCDYTRFRGKKMHKKEAGKG